MSRMVRFSMALAGMACALLILVHCSSESNNAQTCPQCLPGQTCGPQTNYQCVPGVPPTGCPAAGCGANAACRTDNVCACNPGFFDCDQNVGQVGGNGCECPNGCNGATCATSGNCSATTPNACGGNTAYCNAGVCAQCPAEMFNCDGINDCEAATCGSTPSGCSPSTAGDCGKEQYCAGTTCTTCPAGTFNCDGINDCESATPCGCDPAKAHDCGSNSKYCTSNRTCELCPTDKFNCDGVDACEAASCVTPPAGCDAECIEFSAGSHCVKNAASGDRCEECLTDAHCTGNPRSNGPICDTTDVAGTGFNFCVCKSPADCTDSTRGKLCKVTPSGATNPDDFKQCSCETDGDCPPAYPICEGEMFKSCVPFCRKDDPATPDDENTCKKFGSVGFCDTVTGKCSY